MFRQKKSKYVIGVAVMDQKARSKPMRNILQKIMQYNNDKVEFETVIFGDKVILDEEVENWPGCDFLISFYSTGFPLNKAIQYQQLRNPFCINELQMQKILFDRRLVLMLLDAINVRTPPRLVVSRDGGPVMPIEVQKQLELSGINLTFKQNQIDQVKVIDEDTIEVNGVQLTKPFVEKPVSGEDHNVWIYYHSSRGGGVRKLFRKIANKSSEYIPGPCELRIDGSYIYEKFMDVDNSEDVKVYTVGPNNVHAETRKSPVVDGIVRRNAEGKEVRYVTQLNEAEQKIASQVCIYFKQTVCGLDLLRVNGESYVIDVNGWSFVKGNDDYYDMCARCIREFCLEETKFKRKKIPRDPSFEKSWTLKGYLSVFRHADRTPKQKLKFYTSSQPFVLLLRDSITEILMKKPEELKTVIAAANEARDQGLEDVEKMNQLSEVLERKMTFPGTKVQVKPFFSKEDGLLEKVQIVVKWGGEFTHAGSHQSKDLGENLRKDLLLVNKELLDDVLVYSSSERRVLATTDVFMKSFLNNQEFNQDIVSVRKDMLDDSYDAKEQMDSVKVKLQKILSVESLAQNTLPESVNPHEQLKDPAKFAQELIELLSSRREIMKQKYLQPDIDSVQKNWCCNESPVLFKERWDRLFKDLCDTPRQLFDPSKIPELYDSLKYDSLHNREFIDHVFVDKNEPIPDVREPLRQMYHKSKILFDLIAPCEYGISVAEKLEIGILTSFTLLKQLVNDISQIKDGPRSSTRFYFTKESHVHTLYNVIRLCLSPNVQEIPELDYLTQITFELYERKELIGSSSSRGDDDQTEYSLRIGFSPGAHDSGLIDTQMDYRHSLTVAPRTWLTDHLPLDDALRSILPNLNTPKPSPRCSPKLQLRNYKRPA